MCHRPSYRVSWQRTKSRKTMPQKFSSQTTSQRKNGKVFLKRIASDGWKQRKRAFRHITYHSLYPAGGPSGSWSWTRHSKHCILNHFIFIQYLLHMAWVCSSLSKSKHFDGIVPSFFNWDLSAWGHSRVAITNKYI